MEMPVHEEVLRAAVTLCRRRGGWRFRPVEIVRALPHLEAGTIRTHVVSRCCVNAPRNHPHKWDYFERVSRGLYEIRSPYRRKRAARKREIAEPRGAYRVSSDARLRDTVHAVVTESRDWYVAECLEVAVVTQGRTLDELVANLREALDLHLEGEDPAVLGLSPSPRVAVSYEIRARSS
jgi:predicted RNase H-like HicB family nuclease